tara:strand:+ start:2163 stop:2483 length:321 start_codon:yes stop_codon:yes gene_type:complete
MFKVMKKVFIFIGVLVSMLVFTFFYFTEWNAAARKSKQNVINSEKLEIGMDSLQVKRIMGEPDARSDYDSENNIPSFYYQPPYLASDGIFVHFDSLGIVKRIVYFE